MLLPTSDPGTGPTPPWISHVRAFDLVLPVVRAPLVLARFDADALLASRLSCADEAAMACVRTSVPRRRAEFVAGRWAARRLVPGWHAAPPAIGIGAHREPRWPDGFLGSISHAASSVAATVLPNGSRSGIGIDLEAVVSADVASTLRAQVLNDAELDVLRGCGLDELYALTLAFSAKESFFKAAFATVGAYFDFDAVRISRLDTTGGELRLVTTRALAPGLPAHRAFDARFTRVDASMVLTALAW